MKRIERDKLKKIATSVVIGSVIVAAIIGALLIFKVFSFGDIVGNILLSLLALTVAGIVLLGSLDAMDDKNRFAPFACGMLLGSLLLFLGWIWIPVLSNLSVYQKITILISMVSVMLNVIVANTNALGRKLFILQIVSYVTLGYIELTASLCLFGIYALLNVWAVFALVVIVFFASYVILQVKVKQAIREKEFESVREESRSIEDEDTVTLPREEYEAMKKELDELRKIVSERK